MPATRGPRLVMSDVAALNFRPMQTTETDLRLFQEAFVANEQPRSLDLLRWQYFEPPAGKLFVDFAVVEGPAPSLAAIYAVFPVTMRVGGQRALGVQSLDTLTAVAFRGKGLFTRMARAVYERCAKEGVDIVYGFPNGNSAHGFFTKLDWKSHDPMPMMLKPLRAGYAISRATRGRLRLPKWLDMPLGAGKPRPRSGWELRPVTEVGPEFDNLWNTFAAAIPFAVERDSEYLRWRLKRPDARYQVAGLFAGNRMIGYVVTAMTDKASGSTRAGKIMELISDPAQPGADAFLLRHAVHEMRKEGCSVVWAWNFDHSPNHAAFRRAGFFTLPPRLVPAELHAGARSLTTPPSLAAGERRNWYVSMFDSDTD